MRNVLTYGDIKSSDYDIYVLNVDDENSTERDIETVSVPGRNGDLHFDNGRYSNITRKYQCYARGNAGEKVPAYIASLMSVLGYQRIEDSMHPDYYKVGEILGNISPRFSTFKTGSRFDLEFDCKPQKWMKSGEKETTITSSAKLYNPTLFDAKPLMYITGSGNLGINSDTIAIAAHDGVMVLDFELGDAYSQSSHANYNQYVTLTGNDFPVLRSGDNNIVAGGSLNLTVIPRWWTL